MTQAQEQEFRRFLEGVEWHGTLLTEKGIDARIARVKKVEEILNTDIETIVSTDTNMRDALLKLRPGDVKGNFANAVRRYYKMRRGVEFPPLREVPAVVGGNMYSLSNLMLTVSSDCIGRPIRDRRVNVPSRTVWDTGAFTEVILCADIGEPQSPIPLILCPPKANLRFDVTCMKLGNSDISRVSVNLQLKDENYGELWTVLSVICPSDVSQGIDFGRFAHGLREYPKDGKCTGEHVVYDEHGYKNGCEITLIEDIPHCREIVSCLCRELTVQLYGLGYWLRPLTSNEVESVDE